MSTTFPSATEIERHWYVVDAEDQVLGRLASRVATVLMGKHKPLYTPFLDCGDHVVVVNAEKVVLTGNKTNDKVYRRHSGYPGGLTTVKARRLLRERPERLIQLAIGGMLPKTRLGRQMRKKLRVYAGPEHPHEAQQPQALELE